VDLPDVNALGNDYGQKYEQVDIFIFLFPVVNPQLNYQNVENQVRQNSEFKIDTARMRKPLMTNISIQIKHIKQKSKKKLVFLVGTQVKDRKRNQNWPEVMKLEKGLTIAEELKITKYTECQLSYPVGEAKETKNF
jgi:hypothetical protein